MARWRDHPWTVGLGAFSVAFATLPPLSHLVPPSYALFLAGLAWMLGAGILGLVLLVLLINALGAVADQREPDYPQELRSSRPRVRAATAALSLAALVGAPFLYDALCRGLPHGAWLERFDAAGWHAPTSRRPDRRRRMLGDLVERVLPKLNRDEAQALLGEAEGPPSRGDPQVPRLTYVVGNILIDDLVLEIEYDQAGRYVTHSLFVS